MTNPSQHNLNPEKVENYNQENWNLKQRNYSPLPNYHAGPPLDPLYQKYYHGSPYVSKHYNNILVAPNSPPSPLFLTNQIPLPSFGNYNNLQLIGGIDSPNRINIGNHHYTPPLIADSYLQAYQPNRNIDPYHNSPPRLSLVSLPPHPIQLDNNRASPPRIAQRSISPPIIHANPVIPPNVDQNRLLIESHPALQISQSPLLLHPEEQAVNLSPPHTSILHPGPAVILDSPSPPAYKTSRAAVIHNQEDYIENEIEHHPIMKSRERITMIQRPNKGIRKIHKIPPLELIQPAQPIQFTSNRGFRYPVTYKIGPARIRNPNEIHEDLTIVHSPEHYVYNENYIDYEPVSVAKRKTRIVEQPVIEEEEIIPQTILTSRKVHRPAAAIQEITPVVNAEVEYEPIFETYRRRNRLDINDPLIRNPENGIKFSKYASYRK